MLTTNRKEKIVALLKGIETGDPASIAVVNPDKYIQHNPQTFEGGEGLAALFKRLAKSSPRVNIARLFSDGDFVFGHTEYDFDTSRVGFEIFRFEGNQTVEHWDNIQLRKGPNQSGHSMVDGETELSDQHKTQDNRETIADFVSKVLINGEVVSLASYIDESAYTEHSPSFDDSLVLLRAALTDHTSNQDYRIAYKQIHHLLADGNFVLTVCEGSVNDTHTSFFDLYRLDNGKIVEHWDTTEAVPPISEWKNDNGKF